MSEFLFGAAYYAEYMPCDRVDEDLRLMKDAGMNVIRIAESTWSTWEPCDGQFDFSILHRVLDSAEKYGLKVIIGTPTYAIPAWLYKKHPDILSVTREGSSLYGHRQLADITNDHYLFHAERIIRHLMEECASHPCVIGYQLDNETRAAGACNEAIQKKFVNKLREKYITVENLNREFGLNYWSNSIGSFDDFPDIRGTINGSLSAAYERFLRDCITEFLTWQAKIINEYRRDSQFITHNFDFGWRDYSYGLQPLVDQVATAECMDIAGCDIYHPTQDKLTGAEISLCGAIAYSLKRKNYYVLETQSQGNLEWLPYPGQLKQNIISHISSGATGIMYWNWHSIHNSAESYWKGILSHDLTPHETYDEICECGRLLKDLAQRYGSNGLKPLYKAAILVDNASLSGINEFPFSHDRDYNDILRAYFDACYELNLNTAVCHVTDTLEDFMRYPLLIVPALYSATDDTIEKLRSYVKGGGHLLMSFKSLFSDGEIKIYKDAQPHKMTDIFGMTYDRFTRPENVTISFSAETEYKVTDWMELLKPLSEDTEVWAKYTHPYWGAYAAITHRRQTSAAGGGSATYVGCFLDREALKPVIKKLCSLCSNNLSPYTFPLIIKECMTENGQKISFCINYSSEPLTFLTPFTGRKVTIPAWGYFIDEA